MVSPQPALQALAIAGLAVAHPLGGMAVDAALGDRWAHDGRRRADCTRNAIAKLKPGGMLIIDNSERAEYQKKYDE